MQKRKTIFMACNISWIIWRGTNTTL